MWVYLVLHFTLAGTPMPNETRKLIDRNHAVYWAMNDAGYFVTRTIKLDSVFMTKKLVAKEIQQKKFVCTQKHEKHKQSFYYD